MSTVEKRPGKYLCGVKTWAQWFSFGKAPRYEIYTYIGVDAFNGTYFFQARSNPALIISKTIYQLNTNGFKPFCIDSTEYFTYLNKLGVGVFRPPVDGA